ncbi:MAG: DUF3127 domain-containing protein [Bacteroidetes bacterium]|nr:DUF3127 domain-containing protein [Bacteroidota bacterium]MDA1121717.1 DUF3127 domain-containing protein [Bacteroidota bacterium]
MNIKGKLTEKFETSKITDSFQKREFVIEYAENPMYPEFVKFELTQDKCALIDPFNPGDEIDVEFNLKGRKWTDPQGQVKYFNSLQAWKVNPMQQMESQPYVPESTPVEKASPAAEPDWLKNSTIDKESLEDDDLPF